MIRHGDRLQPIDEDEGVVTNKRHTGRGGETISHHADLRSITNDRQLRETPLPLRLEQFAWASRSQAVGPHERERCLDRDDCARAAVGVHSDAIKFSGRPVVGVERAVGKEGETIDHIQLLINDPQLKRGGARMESMNATAKRFRHIRAAVR